jgi:hypothetical protein
VSVLALGFPRLYTRISEDLKIILAFWCPPWILHDNRG